MIKTAYCYVKNSKITNENAPSEFLKVKSTTGILSYINLLYVHYDNNHTLYTKPGRNKRYGAEQFIK